MLYQEQVHEQEGISNRFGPGVVVEVDPHLGFFQLCSLDLGYPGLQLVPHVEVVVSIKPVVVLFLLSIPDVVDGFIAGLPILLGIAFVVIGRKLLRSSK
jgi:hypothetical protein